VVTRVYLKTYPAFAAINSLAGTILCSNASTFNNLISALVDVQVSVRDHGHAVSHAVGLSNPGASPVRQNRPSLLLLKGLWEADPSGNFVAIYSFVGFLPDENIVSPNQTLLDYSSILDIPGCSTLIQTTQYTGPTSWIETYQNVVVPVISGGDAVGVDILDTSRFISYDLINNATALESIKQAIINSTVPTIWQNCNFNLSFFCFWQRFC
jgi:hypothetical protein